jgi:hypothetical protein
LIVTLFCAANQNGITSEKISTVRDALKTTTVIAYPAKGRPVDQTVAEALQEMMPQAQVLAVTDAGSLKSEGVFRVAIADEGLAAGPQKYGLQAPNDQDWMFVRLTPAGGGELVTFKPHLLYALFCRLKEEWINDDVASLSKGRLERATFRWLEGGMFLLWPGATTSRPDDLERACRSWRVWAARI